MQEALPCKHLLRVYGDGPHVSVSKKILAVHYYHKAVRHTCMEAPEEDVRKSGDCRRGRGSKVGAGGALEGRPPI